jgi:hypothetical protein
LSPTAIVQALAQSQTSLAIVTTQDLHPDGSSQQSVEVDTAFDGSSLAADESATVQFPRKVSASNSDDLQQSPASQPPTGFTVLAPREFESSQISVEGSFLSRGALQLPLAQHPLFAALGPLEALESGSALTSIAGERGFLSRGDLKLPLAQHPVFAALGPLEALESGSALSSIAGKGVFLLRGALQLPLAQHPLTAFAVRGPLEALESESALTSIAGEGGFLLGGALQLPLEQHPEAGSFLTLLDWSEYTTGSALFKRLSLRIS